VPGLLLAGLAAAALACGPRYSRITVHDQGGITIVLRALLKGSSRVDPGYSQPVIISGVRMAHILASIDVRMQVSEDKRGERKAAIPLPLIFELGDLLSKAFAQADSTQQVVVQAIRNERRLGIFSQAYLTSFITFVDDQDRLQIHFYRIDWPVPKGGAEKSIREPRMGVEVMGFRVLPADAIEAIGPQAVAVDWRDPTFRRASNLRITPTGKVVRRQILMESPVAPEAEPGKASETERALPDDPGVLRALADLEEARRSGRITEGEYHRRRKALLKAAGAP